MRKHFVYARDYLKTEYDRARFRMVIESADHALRTLLFAVVGTVAYQERVALGDLAAGAAHTTATTQQALVFGLITELDRYFLFIKHERGEDDSAGENDTQLQYCRHHQCVTHQHKWSVYGNGSSAG
ncbi:MAG: hypothetical protein R3B69_04310 [Candidatus Paceibacterota bacterium]